MSAHFKIGGVPEHFNLPWHLAMEHGFFEREGITLDWTDYRTGTGAMTKALASGELDIAVLLTEGIVLEILRGNPSRIVQKYVNTPLLWGIHSGVNNPLQFQGLIYDKKYAISRYGSGSHLMAMVDAQFKGKHIGDTQWEVINDIDGALASLDAGETDVFFWEKYTTKPYVDEGKLKRVGEFVSPWPCFVIAARNEVIEQQGEALQQLLKVIRFSCKHFMSAKDAHRMVAERYGLREEDALNWFHMTEWCTEPRISEKMLNSVVHTLNATGVTHISKPARELVAPFVEIT